MIRFLICQRTGLSATPAARHLFRQKSSLSCLPLFLLATAFVLAALGRLSAEPVQSLAGTLPASGDYGEVLAAIDASGAEATSLTLYWDDIMQDGVYASDPDWPTIAQAVYPPRGVRIQLTFAVIDTIADRRPKGLKQLAWDDPKTVNGFVSFMEQALSRMPDIDLISIAIGNEVDGVLSGVAVEAYGRFFDQARAATRRIRPGVPVTTKVTWPGLRDRAEIRTLARKGDAVSITWYPMDAAFKFAEPRIALRELDAMARLADGPWELSEVGYPTNGCGASSPETQADFHAGLRLATRLQPDLHLVQRVWSHDISPAEVAAYQGYYQTSDNCFARFLGSLGLRTADDKPKPAFTTLND